MVGRYRAKKRVHGEYRVGRATRMKMKQMRKNREKKHTRTNKKYIQSTRDPKREEWE